MKKLLEDNADRLTPREAEAVWQAVRPALARRAGINRAAPFLAVAAAAAVLLAVALTLRPHTTVAPGPVGPSTVGRSPLVAEQAPVQPAAGLPPQTAGRVNAQPPAGPPSQTAGRVEPQPPAGLPPALAGHVEAQPPTRPASPASPERPPAAATAAGSAPPDSIRLALIRGTVVDSAGYPEAFATILVESKPIGAVSERDGRFTLPGLAAGSYTLNVTKPGYVTETRPVELAAGAEVTVNFSLKPELSAGTGGLVASGAGSSATYLEHLQLPADALRRLNGLAAPDVPKLSEEQRQALAAVPYLGAASGAPPDPSAAGSMSDHRQAQTRRPEPHHTWGSLKSPYGEPRPAPARQPDPDRAPDPRRPREPADRGENFDDMFFQHYGVNPFVAAQDDPLATFALDVDNASYSLTRAYLERHELPPPAAIRVEEFQNVLKQGYAPPPTGREARGAAALAIHLDAAPSPFGRGLVLARVGIKAREVSAADRKPAVLTFVVDVSGSMDSGGRLEMVKEALRRLVLRLDGGDRVGIVAFSNDSRVVLPLTSPSELHRIEAALASLRTEASTNVEAGLRDGYAMAVHGFRDNGINRVILCSDGVANVGLTDADGLLDGISRDARRGIELTTIGVGMGNYNDVLLEQLADRGEGNYYYVDTLDEARRVLEGELTGTLQTVARQTKVQVEFNPDRVERYRLIGYENRAVADWDFRNNQVDAGELGAGHEVTALFELSLRDANELPEWRHRGELGVVRLRYEDPDTREVRELSAALNDGDIATSVPAAPPMLRMDAAVAEFADILRDSYWARGTRLTEVADLARDASHDLGDSPQLTEMVALMDRAARLWSLRQLQAERFDTVRPRWEPPSRGR